MKIQCPCGAKYAFEVTAEMARQPFRLVCQACNTDLGPALQPLIDQAVAELAPPAASPTPVAVAPVPSVKSLVPSPPSGGGGLRVTGGSAAAPTPTPAPAEAGSAVDSTCQRHPGVAVVEHCRVCQKSICPRCMEQFGYVCSAYCQGKAESQNLELPEYAFQHKHTAARESRLFKMGMVAGFVILFAIIGAYGYYVFYASRPHPFFSLKFNPRLTEGACRLLDANSALLVRNGEALRYDLKSQTAVWNTLLVSSNEVAVAAKQRVESERAAFFRWRDEARKQPPRFAENGERIVIPEMPPKSESEHYAAEVQRRIEEIAEHPSLLGEGNEIWVSMAGKLVRIDISTGQILKQVRWPELQPQVQVSGSQMVAMTRTGASEFKTVTVDLASGASEERTVVTAKADIARSLGSANPALRGQTTRPGALTVGNRPGAGGTKPSAASTRRETLPSLPSGLSGPEAAIRAIQLQSNTRLENAMNDEAEVGPRKSDPELLDRSGIEWLMLEGQPLKFRRHLIEFKGVSRKAMKDPPKNSALNSGASVAQTMEIANEILNEMRREKTGGVEVDDLSRYEVTLERPGNGSELAWKAEVNGPPQILLLPSLVAIVAHDLVIILDAKLQKKWETRLSYPLQIPEFTSDSSSQPMRSGELSRAPITERGDSLFIVDPGVLSVFDKNTGAARWRLPSVEISSLYFAPDGALYVNTTTKSQEQIVYSQEVDVSRKDQPLILKVEAASGKVLWRTPNCGHVAALDGKFLYAIEIAEGVAPNPIGIGASYPTQFLLYRLNPKNGKRMWEYAKSGQALGFDAAANTIQILLPYELQVIRYATF